MNKEDLVLPYSLLKIRNRFPDPENLYYRKEIDMSRIGFVDEYLDNANRFYSIAMNQFDFYLKLMGTDVTIVRVKDDSKDKELFGATFTSDMLGDGDVDRLKYRILINLNDMRKIYQQTADQFEVFDNRDVMKLGDLIIYQRREREYKFKVIDVQAFSEAKNVLYRYTLQGYQEVNSLI